MLASRTMLEYLIENETELYPRLAAQGEKMRRILESAFRDEGIYAHCTGDGNDAVPGSSLAYVHFPYRDTTSVDRPETLFDPSACDVELSAHVLQLALLLEDVYVVHGHGAVSAAHDDDDMAFFERACRKAARRIKSSL